MTPRQLGTGLVLLALILGLAGLSRQAQGAPAAATVTAGPTKTPPAAVTVSLYAPVVVSGAGWLWQPGTATPIPPD